MILHFGQYVRMSASFFGSVGIAHPYWETISCLKLMWYSCVHLAVCYLYLQHTGSLVDEWTRIHWICVTHICLGQQVEMLCTVSLVTQVISVTLKLHVPCVIPGFRREIDKVCALLVCYAAYVGNSVLISSNKKFLELFTSD